MILDIVFSLVGLVLLAKAADQFVLGAARLALVMRISAVVVGAVIVGFGTSAPEMLVSGVAAWQGDAEVGVGNVIGSNVANLTLVLGAAALILPIGIAGSTLRRETPLMVVSVVLFAVLVQGGITVVEAIVLLVALGASLVVIIRFGGGQPDPELEREVAEYTDRAHLPRVRVEALRTLGGLVGTVVGAQLLVMGAVGIADSAGLSGGFVGFTLVAIGTSLPELVTAVAAARAGEPDLIVGNLLGSNIFNSLAVGAVLVLAGGSELDAPRLLSIGAIAMVVVALGVWAMMLSNRRIVRWEGAVLLVVYVGAVALIGPGG
ncbi:MAG: calcium/sodium antiporter [Acidimicrobiales bacterium]